MNTNTMALVASGNLSLAGNLQSISKHIDVNISNPVNNNIRIII